MHKESCKHSQSDIWICTILIHMTSIINERTYSQKIHSFWNEFTSIANIITSSQWRGGISEAWGLIITGHGVVGSWIFLKQESGTDFSDVKSCPLLNSWIFSLVNSGCNDVDKLWSLTCAVNWCASEMSPTCLLHRDSPKYPEFLHTRNKNTMNNNTICNVRQELCWSIHA